MTRRFSHFDRRPIHAPLDNSVLSESEQIRPSYLDGKVAQDLACYTMDYLKKHYPEYEFGWEPRGKKPKGKTVCAAFRGGWRWATWRTK